jgi:hypothetical protein
MERVRHPIYSNSGEIKSDYRPKKGINIGRHCVNGYSITAAPTKSVTHVSFWWCAYRAQSNVGKLAPWPVAWVIGCVKFCVRGYEVPSEPSELSRTPRCFRRKQGLLLMHPKWVDILPCRCSESPSAPWIVASLPVHITIDGQQFQVQLQSTAVVLTSVRIVSSAFKYSCRLLHYSSQLQDLTIPGFWSYNFHTLPIAPSGKYAVW